MLRLFEFLDNQYKNIYMFATILIQPRHVFCLELEYNNNGHESICMALCNVFQNGKGKRQKKYLRIYSIYNLLQQSVLQHVSIEREKLL